MYTHQADDGWWTTRSSLQCCILIEASYQWRWPVLLTICAFGWRGIGIYKSSRWACSSPLKRPLDEDEQFLWRWPSSNKYPRRPKTSGENYAELSHTATETQRAINLAANKTPRWGLAYVTHDILTHSVHENIYDDTLARDTSLTSSYY